MKIIMLEGSPNRNGSSAMLAGEFARGAKEAGHDFGKRLRDALYDREQPVHDGGVYAWKVIGIKEAFPDRGLSRYARNHGINSQKQETWI